MLPTHPRESPRTPPNPVEPDSAAAIMRFPILDRRALIDTATHRVQQHIPEATPWAAITSTLTFFHRAGWGAPVAPDEPGDFISVTDAYVIEAVLRGVALAYDGATEDYDNPAAALWARYLTQISGHRWRSGAARVEHDALWSRAEHVATEHGKTQAEQRGAVRTETQYRWYLLSAFYRSVMVDPPNDLLTRVTRVGPVGWFADTTRPRPVRHGAEVAHALARFSPGAFVTSTARAGLGYLADLTLSTEKA